MSSSEDIEIGSRVEFSSSGIDITTGTVCGIGENNCVAVHPDGYGEHFSVLVPIGTLTILHEENSENDREDVSFRHLPRGRRRRGDSPYFA